MKPASVQGTCPTQPVVSPCIIWKCANRTDLFNHCPEWVQQSLGLWSFDTVLGAGFLAVLHTQGIEGPADNVIPDPWEVLHPATPYDHY